MRRTLYGVLLYTRYDLETLNCENVIVSFLMAPFLNSLGLFLFLETHLATKKPVISNKGEACYCHHIYVY